ncbi:hypothetical protein [Kitasatospora azatica]|uniref:hypothetical protein n=1 Tax=Kitasatospora azatica TaxID=58347 RepID=UPI00055E8C3B|nr:hypothetical protein [Kitasatospora azatica]
MDWSSLASGVLGVLVGGSITAVTAHHQLLRGRQWNDAEAFGPALLLLDSIRDDPHANLTAKYIEACERLHVVAAGHPRKHVRKNALRALGQLVAAYKTQETKKADDAMITLINANLSRPWLDRPWLIRHDRPRYKSSWRSLN